MYGDEETGSEGEEINMQEQKLEREAEEVIQYNTQRRYGSAWGALNNKDRYLDHYKMNLISSDRLEPRNYAKNCKSNLKMSLCWHYRGS